MMTTDPTPTVAFTMRQPDRIANLNDRTHWAVKARTIRAWRQAVALQARRVGGVPTPANVHICFDVADNRRRDAHNTAPVVKACVDGLVDAGWFEDDDTTRVTVIDPTFRVVGRKVPLSVTITATRRQS